MVNFFKNPYFNGFLAEFYIIILVSTVYFWGRPNTPDKFLDPAIFLSVFVLSAALMGYLFLGEPVQLFLNGEKRQAFSFFFKTVASFALLTFVIVILRIVFMGQ